MLKGVDLSHHQRNFNSFNNVDFAIIKATEGVGYVDDACDTLYQRCKQAGKLLGVYHYARPDLRNTPEAEAIWFVKNIKNYLNEAIIVLDWEEGNLGDVSWAKAWLDKVKELTGIKPLIYMSNYPVNAYNWSSVANADYGLWVANYGANTGAEGNRPSVKWWSFYFIWQYTSKGHVQGYIGNVDLNNAYGDAVAWRKYANASGTTLNPEKPKEPTKKPNEEIANEVIEGKWGNGDERKKRLTDAGYNYQEIQGIVNAKLGIDKKPTLAVGVKVRTIKEGNGASDGSSNKAYKGNVGTISRIIEGAKYPYLVSKGKTPLGWYKADALEIC